MAGNRLFLTLDEQRIDFPVPRTEPSARLAAAMAGFSERVGGYPGFAGIEVQSIDEADLPGRDVACALYVYSQDLRGITEVQGALSGLVGFGQLCVDTEGPPDSAWLVIAELSITWGLSLGQAPSSDEGEAARELLGALRIE